MRLLAYWVSASLVGYVVVVLPLVVLMAVVGVPTPVLSLASFVIGMFVGGLSPIVGLERSSRVRQWVGR